MKGGKLLCCLLMAVFLSATPMFSQTLQAGVPLLSLLLPEVGIEQALLPSFYSANCKLKSLQLFVFAGHQASTLSRISEFQMPAQSHAADLERLQNPSGWAPECKPLSLLSYQ